MEVRWSPSISSIYHIHDLFSSFLLPWLSALKGLEDLQIIQLPTSTISRRVTDGLVRSLQWRWLFDAVQSTFSLLQGKTKNHPPGSLEMIVENLAMPWEEIARCKQIRASHVGILLRWRRGKWNALTSWIPTSTGAWIQKRQDPRKFPGREAEVSQETPSISKWKYMKFRTCCACTCKDYVCKHSQPKWHCHFGSSVCDHVSEQFERFFLSPSILCVSQWLVHLWSLTASFLRRLRDPCLWRHLRLWLRRVWTLFSVWRQWWRMRMSLLWAWIPRTGRWWLRWWRTPRMLPPTSCRVPTWLFWPGQLRTLDQDNDGHHGEAEAGYDWQWRWSPVQARGCHFRCCGVPTGFPPIHESEMELTRTSRRCLGGALVPNLCPGRGSICHGGSHQGSPHWQVWVQSKCTGRSGTFSGWLIYSDDAIRAFGLDPDLPMGAPLLVILPLALTPRGSPRFWWNTRTNHAFQSRWRMWTRSWGRTARRRLEGRRRTSSGSGSKDEVPLACAIDHGRAGTTSGTHPSLSFQWSWPGWTNDLGLHPHPGGELWQSGDCLCSYELPESTWWGDETAPCCRKTSPWGWQWHWGETSSWNQGLQSGIHIRRRSVFAARRSWPSGRRSTSPAWMAKLAIGFCLWLPRAWPGPEMARLNLM